MLIWERGSHRRTALGRAGRGRPAAYPIRGTGSHVSRQLTFMVGAAPRDTTPRDAAITHVVMALLR